MMDMTEAVSINSGDLSTEVVVNIVRTMLRDAAGDDTLPLDDPNSGSRPSESEFILTSYPDRAAFFPLIVVDEFEDNNRRIDGQADYYQHDYSVRIQIYAKSNTDLYKIRDNIRHLFEYKYKDLSYDGFAQPSIESSTAAQWEEDREVQRWEMIISGLVHTESSI